MRVAVPVLGGSFCAHFGGADKFALVDVDDQSRTMTSTRMEAPPPHEHGVFPMWLRSQGVTTVLAGGMGPRAVQIFQRLGIETVLGIDGGEPEQLVRAFLDGTLVASGEGCGGGELHHCHDHGEP